MIGEVLQRAMVFDRDEAIKRSVDVALEKLRVFREKYPFTENPEAIERLSPEDVFRRNTGEIGEFFRYIEYYLKPLGGLRTYPKVYLEIREQIDLFKHLLYVVVDNKKSLAEKVDAPWSEIKGLGGDSHIAKKIIFCFNYETGSVIPIFSTSHLEHFLNIIHETPWRPIHYGGLSLGKKYETLTEKLLKAKESSQVTSPWEITYFCRFLYETYTPPKKPQKLNIKNSLKKALTEQQERYARFMALLKKLKEEGKISAEQLRAYKDQWQKNPEIRQTLIDELSN
ncbi:hypothetical protein KEJ21_01170 [Candidatus Bathyarchaeota archaeon]|nr:hypothetical protein [Candidatus Bathyarchaeota archaeon]MBS7630224.1 hypothetical protein [Candidatus Bathyarchaeota archaeon]